MTAKSRGRKSRAARSEWAHSKVFSSDDEEDVGGNSGGKSKASLWGDAGPPAKPPRSQVTGKKVGFLAAEASLYRSPRMLFTKHLLATNTHCHALLVLEERGERRGNLGSSKPGSRGPRSQIADGKKLIMLYGCENKE